MKRSPKPNLHLQRMQFVCQRINEINAWRNEAIKSASTQQQRDAIDARAFELRNTVEKN